MRKMLSILSATLGFAGLASSSLVGCSTVRPQERAILADPTMVFEAEPRLMAPLHHTLDNREGSMGGAGVGGGGCGCN